MKKDGKDEIEKKVERLEKETEEQRVCIKEKDKRITKMEERWEIIHGAGITIWYGFWIFISYWLVLNAWVQIDANGKYSLLEYFNANTFSSIRDYGHVPHVLDDGPGLMLAIIMVIILILLTFGWFFWICIIRDDE